MGSMVVTSENLAAKFGTIAVELPINHNLVWLYVLPASFPTWLTTRPVIESKRLPELVSSQLR